MSSTRALLLLPFAAIMLALAALDAPVIAGLQALGLDEGAVAEATPLVTASLATVGFLLLLVVLVVVVRNSARADRARPYRDALRSFAAEFGRGVSETPDGLSIELLRDGQRVEVFIDPHVRGVVSVRSAPPARQALAWFVQGNPPPAPASGWREVDHGVKWVMRAELPAMARPLLADGGLMDVVGRFFALREARAITHTLAGMLIEAALPAPADIDAQVRLSTEIAFRLRRVNG